MTVRETQGHIGGCMCGICLIERNRRDARELPAARWDRMRALVEAGWHSGWGAVSPEREIDWADIKRAEADADRMLYGDAGTFMRGGEPG